ncbi:MAG: TrbI/VirB10 family protein [Sulfurovum sp.]
MSMDPKQSPNGLKNKPTGIKRLNNIPLLIFLGIIAIIVVSLVFAMSQRANQIKKDQEPKEVAIKDSDPSSKITAWEEQSRQTAQPSSRIPGIVDANTEAGEEKTTTEQATDSGTPTVTTPQMSQEQIEEIKREKQRVTEAMRSPSRVRIEMQQNSSSPVQRQTGNFNQPDSTSMTPALIAALAAANQTATVTEKNEKFQDQAKKSWDYLDYGKTDLISPYEIKTGTMIPSVMISGINSELPGDIIAQVRENVYDTATGNYLLIPQGAKLIGRYNADVTYGQSRAMVVWQRIIFPHGQTLNIEAMQGVDQGGYAGFEDQVDNHYFRIFGSAFLISVLSGEFQFSKGDTTIGGQQQSNAYGTTVSQTGEKLLEKNLAVAPTIKIRPGYKFNVFVNKDMILEPYQ